MLFYSVSRASLWTTHPKRVKVHVWVRSPVLSITWHRYLSWLTLCLGYLSAMGGKDAFERFTFVDPQLSMHGFDEVTNSFCKLCLISTHYVYVFTCVACHDRTWPVALAIRRNNPAKRCICGLFFWPEADCNLMNRPTSVVNRPFSAHTSNHISIL